MKKFQFKSIRTRLVTWLYIVSMLPLLAILIILYFKNVGEIKNKAYEKLSVIRDLKVKQLEVWYNERHIDLAALANNRELKATEVIFSHVDSDEYRLLRGNINTRLNDFCANYEDFLNVSIINPNTGIIMYSSDNGQVGSDVSESQYFKGAKESDGHYHNDVYFSEIENDLTMTFVHPVLCLTHKGAHLIGFIAGNIDLYNELYPLLLDRYGLGETGETLVVNNNGLALNELRWYVDAPLKLKISALPAYMALQGEQGTIIATDYRGVEVIAAYSFIPSVEWGFVCKQDWEELNDPLQSLILSFIIIFIFSTLIIGVAIAAISRTLTKPITDMDNVLKNFQAGDYSARNIITKVDEIGVLGKAFNDMMDSTMNNIQTQKTITDIVETLYDKSSIIDFGSHIIKKILSSTSSDLGAFYILSENIHQYELVAIGGMPGHKLYDSIKIKYPKIEFKNAILSKKISYINRIPKNTKFKLFVNGKMVIPQEIVTIPVLIENSVVALLSFANSDYFKEGDNVLFSQLWRTINTSYSNLISNERTRIFADQLSRINKQLEEQSEEIKSRVKELHEQTKILENTSGILKMRNIELEEQRKQVEEANMELEAFSYSVSHDLRAPLRAIAGFTRILIDDYASKFDEDGKRIGAVIQKNAQKMGNLIDDLLAFSRIGRVSLNFSNIDMKNMVNAIYHEITSVKERKQIKLTISDLPAINGDTSMMRQVWINLISNAVKFSSRRKQSIISVSSKEEKDKIIYIIKDNGVGFDMRYYDKLFGVFQRLHSEKEFSGTGVGLALAQRIIHRHNGTIWAESEVDKGASFYFSILKNRKA